jgi:tRNA/tmRNA/rRNA uracil-C5-methylase (TrmA/RlmC/RlmD family)
VLDLEVGAPGHGGFCVARAEGRVVFVRHALPGEKVRALVTEDGGKSFCRADAIEVGAASPDRAPAPCPHAGPGRCGGCDWQHASAAAQRRLKADVVREQFRRLAEIDLDLEEVEALPGGLLGWRSRVGFAVGPDGEVGLHRHRSAEIEPVDNCPLGVAEVADARRPPAGATGIVAVRGAGDGAGAGAGAEVTVLAHRPGPGRQARGRRPPDRVSVVEGPPLVHHRLGARVFAHAAAGFWQVHPHALGAFAAAVLQAVAPAPGESALDLYAGAGPLTAVLAEAVGPDGRVLGLESSAAAVADAEANLADLPWARVRRERVDADTLHALDVRPDIVVLDPPRAGAGVATMRAILELRPRAVAYVSCDPATLARDVAAATGLGWTLARLRAFDAFPMTHHIECVATLVPAAGTPSAKDIGPDTAGSRVPEHGEARTL